MSRIVIDGVSKNFGALSALDNVSLSLGAGRSLALIGPTAAGKSVLLKCLVGLYATSGGQILIDGEAVGAATTRAHALKRRIGMLFQQNALFDSLPVWENIAFQLIADGLPRHQARGRAEELLPHVGLPASTATLFPSDLSGGMQKRVGFARAIATQPDIVLLDNPTAGLDPILAARVDAMIGGLVHNSQTCVISVTGNMVGITEAYDEIAVLHDGVLRWHGTGKEAESDENPWLRQLLAGQRDGPITTRIAAA